jgi:hypothetical protein
MTLFHGTIRKNYKKILKEGIKKYSFFTPFRDTAVSMGGPYVFGVDFPNVTDQMLCDGGWEWCCQESIPTNKIEYIVKIKVKILKYNSKLMLENRKKVIDEDPERNWCPTCTSHEELTYLDDGHWLLPTGSSFSHCNYKSRKTNRIIPCPVCNLKKNPNWDSITNTIKLVEDKLGKKFNAEDNKCIQQYIKLYKKICKN